MIQFEDDASVCLSDCNLHNLIRKTNTTLSSLSEWTIANKISINATKNEALIVTNILVDLSNVNISFCGELLRVANELTYFRFKIDKNLRFDVHAKYVYSKVHNLSGRSQCVKVGPCFSSVADLPVGVPQVSVLGPLLILLYINDLSNAIEDTSVIQFADDASVCLSDCNLHNLIRKTNTTLSSLSEWTIAYQM